MSRVPTGEQRAAEAEKFKARDLIQEKRMRQIEEDRKNEERARKKREMTELIYAAMIMGVASRGAIESTNPKVLLSHAKDFTEAAFDFIRPE